MPGGTRAGRGLAYWTVHWRIRPRPARPDNRRKRVTNSESRAEAGRARLADRTAARLIRDAKLVTVEGGLHNIGWPRRGQHRPAGVPHQPARRNLSAVGDQS